MRNHAEMESGCVRFALITVTAALGLVFGFAWLIGRLL